MSTNRPDPFGGVAGGADTLFFDFALLTLGLVMGIGGALVVGTADCDFEGRPPRFLGDPVNGVDAGGLGFGGGDALNCAEAGSRSSISVKLLWASAF